MVIYTNGDEEAVAAMETSLKNAGYEGQYLVQSMGTSELGGKLMAGEQNRGGSRHDEFVLYRKLADQALHV